MYPTTPDDAEPDVEFAQQLLERCMPLEEGTAAWAYLVATRGLPAEVVRGCATDLRVLAAPLPGFSDRLAAGVVSLLRDKDGEVSGLALEAHGLAGERVLEGGRTARRTFALKRNGCRDALFAAQVGSGRAKIAYIAEGRLAKPIALAAVLQDSAVSIFGWGGRQCLGFAIPPEPRVIVVEDARPLDEELSE